MKTMEWEKGYDGASQEELFKRLKVFEEKGFRHTCSFSNVPLYVHNPANQSFSMEKLEGLLQGPLVFGNKEQIEALDAAEYFKLCLYFHL